MVAAQTIRLVRDVGGMARRFGAAATMRGHAQRLRRRLLSADSSAVEALRLDGIGTLHLRPGTSDWHVLRQILLDEEYASGSAPHEAALRQCYERICAAGGTPLIIDGGANIGLAARWFAWRFPRARILAVEPEPANFAVLAANARERPAIEPIPAALLDRAVRVDLTNDDGSPWAWRVEVRETPSPAGGGIETVTIPDLIARVPGAVPLIVKLDIEGAEAELFRSNTEWARDVPLIVFEPHDWLFPWRGTFHAAAAVLAASPRDYLTRGENVFAFSHALRPPAA